jgi:hypothetical protein
MPADLQRAREVFVHAVGLPAFSPHKSSTDSALVDRSGLECGSASLPLWFLGFVWSDETQ